MGLKTGSSEFEEIVNIAWGSHFCLFYETRDDLLDAVIPFLRQGLENHEYCLWVSALPVKMKAARRVLRDAIPDFEQYWKEGQIEIIPHTDWYLTKDGFNADHVLQAWIDKLNWALARGYSGMRCVGNTFWLEGHHWNNFAQYETHLDAVISQLKMRILCTYALERCSAENVLDVVQQHQFTLILRRGKWERLERAAQKQLREEIQRLERELQQHLLSHHLSQSIPETGRIVNQELSSREQEVLRLITQGYTNKDIAKTLALSIRTVERYRSSIMKKMGLQNRTELIVYAVTHGFLHQ